MEEQTFKSRLVELLSKSRKAVRLYESVSKSKKGSAIAEIQASEWLSINSDLVAALSALLDDLIPKNLSAETSTILDQFTDRTHATIEQMHVKKRKLVAVAEEMDFPQSLLLSKELISLKARVQALQAVNSELKTVLKRNKAPAETDNQIELSSENVLKQNKVAKIIPLRQKVSLG